MRFCDRAKVFVQSGKGGAGGVSFRRERNIPFGGPDGGNGGRGGHVIIRASKNRMNLIDYHYRQHFKAKTGENGMSCHKKGAAGKDVILEVPIGTEVWSEGQLIEDMVLPNQEIILLKGGEGGRGNATFKSSTNQAPRIAQPGELGEELCIEFKLKILADLGLIGLPNAGKSTFLSVLTDATPKIADYPFTTLIPQLGMLNQDEYGQKESLLIADLPGLIEGAHEGKGLGHRFLAHAERCRGFLHFIDGSRGSIDEDYMLIRHELDAYQGDYPSQVSHKSLSHKKEIVVINKCDLFPEGKSPKFSISHVPVFIVSTLTGEGLPALKDFLCTHFALDDEVLDNKPLDDKAPEKGSVMNECFDDE